MSNIFKGYVVNSCDSEHRDETTDIGQRLISAAQEVAADTYLRITGFRPSVLGK
ncbi:MAG: hypothetical protein R3D88_07330 [Alphaproteobacteria bacterium]|nr:hypothetical protein [Alphaproteobacteria bacterium]